MKIIDPDIPHHRPFLEELRESARHYCRRVKKYNGTIDIVLTLDEMIRLRDEVSFDGPYYQFSIVPKPKFLAKTGVSVTVRRDYNDDR